MFCHRELNKSASVRVMALFTCLLSAIPARVEKQAVFVSNKIFVCQLYQTSAYNILS